jgi:hypothetical protein
MSKSRSCTLAADGLLFSWDVGGGAGRMIGRDDRVMAVRRHQLAGRSIAKCTIAATNSVRVQ